MGCQTPPYVPAPADKRSKIEKWADEALRMIKRLDTDELARAGITDCAKVDAVLNALRDKIDEANHKLLVEQDLI